MDVLLYVKGPYLQQILFLIDGLNGFTVSTFDLAHVWITDVDGFLKGQAQPIYDHTDTILYGSADDLADYRDKFIVLEVSTANSLPFSGGDLGRALGEIAKRQS